MPSSVAQFLPESVHRGAQINSIYPQVYTINLSITGLKNHLVFRFRFVRASNLSYS